MIHRRLQWDLGDRLIAGSELLHCSLVLAALFQQQVVEMGIYLSTPKTEKFYEDDENARVRYDLSSMQGWRTTMEDAYASYPDLDPNTSFFGVYDGHKPELDAEKDQILKAGGFIQVGRVNGSLNLAREISRMEQALTCGEANCDDNSHFKAT